MSQTVGYISDEIHILSFPTSQQTVYGTNDHLDDINILPFIEAPYIIGIRNLTLMKYQINGTGMIFNEQPIPHILASSVNRQGFAMTNIINE